MNARTLSALIVGAAVVIAALILQSNTRADEPPALPEAVTKALKKTFDADSKIEAVVVRQRDGKKVYVIQVRIEDESGYAEIAEDGSVVSAAFDGHVIKAGPPSFAAPELETELPEAVTAALRKAFPQGVIEDADLEMPAGNPVYSVMVDDGGRDVHVIVAADGTIVSHAHRSHRSLLPKAVRDAVTKAAGRGEVTGAERMVIPVAIRFEKLKTPRQVFEVEVVREEDVVQLLIDSSGKILRQRVEEMDEDEEEEEERDEDEERERDEMEERERDEMEEEEEEERDDRRRRRRDRDDDDDEDDEDDDDEDEEEMEEREKEERKRKEK